MLTVCHLLERIDVSDREIRAGLRAIMGGSGLASLSNEDLDRLRKTIRVELLRREQSTRFEALAQHFGNAVVNVLESCIGYRDKDTGHPLATFRRDGCKRHILSDIETSDLPGTVWLTALCTTGSQALDTVYARVLITQGLARGRSSSLVWAMNHYENCVRCIDLSLTTLKTT